MGDVRYCVAESLEGKDAGDDVHSDQQFEAEQ